MDDPEVDDHELYDVLLELEELLLELELEELLDSELALELELL